MADLPLQPASQDNSPVPSFFHWLCLAISLLFVLVFWRKDVLGLYLDLRSKLQTGLRNIRTSLGLDQRLWRRYTRVEELNEMKEDGGLSVKHPTPYPSPRPSEHEDERDRDNAIEESESEESESDSSSSNGNNAHDNGTLSDQLSKYFDPETFLFYEHVLQPSSPLAISLLSSVKSTYSFDGEGEHFAYLDADSDSDWESDSETEAEEVFSIRLITRSRSARVGQRTEANPNSTPNAGWLDTVIEWAVEGFERLHDGGGTPRAD